MPAHTAAEPKLLFRPSPLSPLPLRFAALALSAPMFASCYSGGGGTAPPTNAFYFPIGLAVSRGGNALYAVNSDLDVQYNGGTLQSYDLFRLRADADRLINANLVAGAERPSACAAGRAGPENLCIPFLTSWSPCMARAPADVIESNGNRLPLGEACSPPVDSTHYIQDSRVIGAFATQLQLSPDGSRVFAPVRGDASLTWADVQIDDPMTVPPDDVSRGVAAPGAVPWAVQVDVNNPSSDPFHLECYPDTTGRCTTHAGDFVDTHDTRLQTLPGEPFGMALTPDGEAVALTHQSSPNASLLLSGCTVPRGGSDGGAPARDAPLAANCHALPASVEPPPSSPPSMQFVLSGIPNGGSGIAAIPHDGNLNAPARGCEFTGYQPPCVRPAFLETNRTTPEIDLVRYFNDQGSTLSRPFLTRETAFSLSANAPGTDQRGIAIDPTPRIACRARAKADHADDAACALVGSRVFVASRSPASLIVGYVGAPSASGDGTFDPDRLVITGNEPLAAGPSTVYLAPIVDAAGRYELRVFVVCYDANEIFVYDPDAARVENIIATGPGPFAMAFDRFDLEDVASNAVVRNDIRQINGAATPAGTSLGQPTLKTYRFAYVASFTQSFVQMIDLDDSLPAVSPETFERVVYTLGKPTPPKGQ